MTDFWGNVGNMASNVGRGIESVSNFFQPPNPYPHLKSPIQTRDQITKRMPMGVASPVSQAQIVPHRAGGSAFEQAVSGFQKNLNNFLNQGNNKSQKAVLGAQPTITPTPTPVAPYHPNITIPNSQTGQPYKIPENIAQILLNSFNKSGEATNAAQILHHPRSQTYSPAEVQRYGKENWNYGENASFKTSNIDVKNDNGSIDRGFMRINDRTFAGMQSSPFWRQAMEKRGITSWEDMNDPQKNSDMGLLILMNSNWDSENQTMKDTPEWRRWFAGALSLRYR